MEITGGHDLNPTFDASQVSTAFLDVKDGHTILKRTMIWLSFGLLVYGALRMWQYGEGLRVEGNPETRVQGLGFRDCKISALTRPS